MSPWDEIELWEQDPKAHDAMLVAALGFQAAIEGAPAAQRIMRASQIDILAAQKKYGVLTPMHRQPVRRWFMFRTG